MGYIVVRRGFPVNSDNSLKKFIKVNPGRFRSVPFFNIVRSKIFTRSKGVSSSRCLDEV